MTLDIRQIIQNSADVKLQMLQECTNDIDKASRMMIESIKKGNKILCCGNGGSAADAQHMAAELMGGLRSHDREPISSIALTTDSSFITAWSNDTNYEEIFSRQIEGIGKAGDILVAISTIGNSINVLKAIKTAESKNIKTIILTGKKQGKMKGMGDVLISIPSNDTQRIQEGHILVEHILCELAEEIYLNS